ncbi:DUF4144 family protein [Vibrio tritonius]|uniref:DUF4144 family protein n=1 Tax=Vibrio tritonius TaxID=1435069 RepID=UPI00315D8D68
MKTINKIIWPAVIHLSGDDELISVADEDALTPLLDWRYTEQDRLMDADGRCFVLTPELGFANHSISVNEASELVQKHTFNEGQVCVTKIFFNTIKDAWRAI